MTERNCQLVVGPDNQARFRMLPPEIVRAIEGQTCVLVHLSESFVTVRVDGDLFLIASRFIEALLIQGGGR